jgi:hypothetical protein
VATDLLGHFDDHLGSDLYAGYNRYIDAMIRSRWLCDFSVRGPRV